MAVIFVEILDRRRRVRARTRLERFPATLGRGYQSDVLIDHASISATHARIEEVDGGLVLVDAGSLNGLRALKGRERLPRVPLGPETVVRLGGVQVRFRDPAMPLSKTEVYLLQSRLERPWVVVVALLAASALNLFYYFLDNYGRFDLAKQLGELLTVWLFAATWAGVWSGATWLAHHQMRFLAHLTTVAAFVGAMPVLLFLTKLFAFNLSSTTAAEVARWMMLYLLFAAVFFMHIRLLRAGGLRSRLLSAAVVSALLIGTAALVSVSTQQRFSSVPKDFDGQLLPPAFRLRPAKSADRFFDEAKALREELERLAERE